MFTKSNLWEYFGKLAIKLDYVCRPNTHLDLIAANIIIRCFHYHYLFYTKRFVGKLSKKLDYVCGAHQRLDQQSQLLQGHKSHGARLDK